MKLKTIEIDGKTYAEVQEANGQPAPVYVHDDGKEAAFDAPHTVATISRLNGEAKGHREAKEAAEKALKQFEGIEDPKAALEAIKTMQNLDAKKLVDAGEVEKVKQAAIKAVEEEYAPYKTRAEELEAELRAEKIGGRFSRSKFITEKLAIPPDMVQARFGEAFKLEDGQVVCYDGEGNKIYSRSKPGELASFDEGLEILVEHYPYKDHILKSSGASGSGTAQSSGAGGPKQWTRAQFDAASQKERMEFSRSGGKVVDA